MSDNKNERVDFEYIFIFVLAVISFVAFLVCAFNSCDDKSKANAGIISEVHSYEYRSEDEEEQTEETFNGNVYAYIGNFNLTVYTPYESSWGYKTATGKRSRHLNTCAVDPSVIPYGTIIYINGVEFEAIDCGPGIKGHRIDIFFEGSVKEGVKWLEDVIGKDTGKGYHARVYKKLYTENKYSKIKSLPGIKDREADRIIYEK